MKKILIPALALLIAVSGYATEKSLQKSSVTVLARGGTGSGVVFVRGSKSYVWTAGHVVSDNVVISPDGKIKIFEDVLVTQPIVEQGRTVGHLSFSAKIIRFSPFEKDDLALLLLYKTNALPSVSFYLDKEIPSVGEKVYHVGSWKGPFGESSFSSGEISFVGRILEGLIFDQATCTIFPGSSGGGVYLTDGRCIGIITRGGGETFGLFIPIRRLLEWAKAENCLWALDASALVPDDASK